MAQQGKSAHIHLLQKELYYTETQHISFIHLSVLPISPDNNDLKKRKEKKNQVKISLAPFYGGGVIQSVVCHLADLFALSPKHTQASTTHLCPTIRSCTLRVNCWISTRGSYLIRGVSDGSKARKKKQH